MTNNTEFISLSDNESAELAGGGLFAWGGLAIAIATLIIGECVKNSAAFVEGFREGALAAKTA